MKRKKIAEGKKGKAESGRGGVRKDRKGPSRI